MTWSQSKTEKILLYNIDVILRSPGLVFKSPNVLEDPIISLLPPSPRTWPTQDPSPSLFPSDSLLPFPGPGRHSPVFMQKNWLLDSWSLPNCLSSQFLTSKTQKLRTDSSYIYNLFSVSLFSWHEDESHTASDWCRDTKPTGGNFSLYLKILSCFLIK